MRVLKYSHVDLIQQLHNRVILKTILQCLGLIPLPSRSTLLGLWPEYISLSTVIYKAGACLTTPVVVFLSLVLGDMSLLV